MKPKGYTLNVEEATLGEESKALLIWRRSEEESFSDWKIKVEAGTDAVSNENATVYSVHRSVLATGPKKSSYFEALFKESCEGMNTVELSEDVAAQFPHFLDYMYSQPVESRAVVNLTNWKSMANLASHFQVPKLTEDVLDFIEKDMYNLDHMENYLSEFDSVNVQDELLSSRILHKATLVCAEMIRSINVDSSLLKAISPAMFWNILLKLEESGIVGASTREPLSDEDRNHVCDLAIRYFEISSRANDSAYCQALLRSMMYRDFFVHADVKAAGERALSLLSMMRCNLGLSDRMTLYFYLRKYLNAQVPSVALMDRIVKELPDHIVARLFRESLLNGGSSEVEEETISLRFDITLNYSLRLGELKLPRVAPTERIRDLKDRVALGFRYRYMVLTHNGVHMDDDEPISTYPITPEDNLIEVEWKNLYE